MLRAISICPDQEVTAHLKETVGSIGMVGLARMLNHYPNELNLIRLVRATCPEMVFLSVESLDRALEVAAILGEHAPGTVIVAVSCSRDPQVLEQLIRSEIREFLLFPFRPERLMEAVMRAEKSLTMRPPGIASTDLLFAFLPSKAGVGTSTIALNTSMALSKRADSRVLLSDFDLNSGVIQFMLRLSHRYSVIDAAQRSAELDEYLWPELVYSIENLDVLHAGDCDPCDRVQTTQLHQLLDFARRHYRVICADLSGNLEQYSLEIMRESRRVFLVCTPDIASVHLARKKYRYLETQELGERVSLLLNRAESDLTISTAQIEEIVGLPVWRAFPNDYRAVRKALFDGKAVDPGTKLGQQFTSMARVVLEGKARSRETAPEWVGSVSNWLFSRLSRRVPLPVHR